VKWLACSAPAARPQWKLRSTIFIAWERSLGSIEHLGPGSDRRRAGGASAAITAARAGVQVLLLEKDNFPRHKVCGEFVSGESLQLLNSLLANSLETRQMLSRVPRIDGVRLFLDGRTVHVPIEPPAASLARYDMDAALWRLRQRPASKPGRTALCRTLQAEAPSTLARLAAP